jgi:hypothetical protein
MEEKFSEDGHSAEPNSNMKTYMFPRNGVVYI